MFSKLKELKKVALSLTFLLAFFMIFAGINHFLKPEMYFPFIPDFLFPKIVNYLVGILEVGLGIGVVVRSIRQKATLGIFLLLLMFLPIHLVDVFSEAPIIGNGKLALLRLAVQFVLLFWAWFVYRKSVETSAS